MKTIRDKQIFVRKNVHVLSEYDLNKIHDAIYYKAFTEKTGIYCDSNSGHVMNVKYYVTDRNNVSTSRTYEVNTNITIEENLSAIKKILKEKKVKIEEYKSYMEFRYLFESHFFRRNESHFTIHGEYHLSSLINFLRFLINGIADKDLKESHDFMDAINIKHSDQAYGFTMGDIAVKRLKNGKLDISGLTDQQNKTINRFIEISKSLNR